MATLPTVSAAPRALPDFVDFQGTLIGVPRPSDTLAEDAWKVCPPRVILNHLDQVHFEPYGVNTSRVARFDLELCAFRGIDVGGLPPRIYSRLMNDDAAVSYRMHRQGVADRLSIGEYRLTLVQNLRFMEDLGLVKIDWDFVETLYPGACRVEVVPLRDSRDGSFEERAVQFLSVPEREFFRKGGFSAPLMESAWAMIPRSGGSKRAARMR